MTPSCYECKRQNGCHDLNQILQQTQIPVNKAMRKVEAVYILCEIKNLLPNKEGNNET
jgi:hypothetical protein